MTGKQVTSLCLVCLLVGALVGLAVALAAGSFGAGSLLQRKGDQPSPPPMLTFRKPHMTPLHVPERIQGKLPPDANVVLHEFLANKNKAYETHAIARLLLYHTMQQSFRCKDRYGIGKSVNANPMDGGGYRDLYQVGYPDAPRGGVLGLINQDFANASFPYTRGKEASWGYMYADITGDSGGPYDFTEEFGLCASPVSYERTGIHVYIINAKGEVYRKDFSDKYLVGEEVRPVTTWPDVEAEGWELVVR